MRKIAQNRESGSHLILLQTTCLTDEMADIRCWPSLVVRRECLTEALAMECAKNVLI